MIIDTHAHIQFKSFDEDRGEVIARCREKNTILNLVSTQTTTSKKAVEMANNNDDMYATIGLHPIHVFPTRVDEEDDSFVSRYEEFDEAYYESLLSEKVVGVGECGIDLFHIPDDVDTDTVIAKQKEIFLAQVKFAIEHDLSLVVHCRDGESADGKPEKHWNAHAYVIETLSHVIPSNHPDVVREGVEGSHSEKDNEISPRPVRPMADEVGRDDVRLQGVIHCYTSNWENAKQYLDLGFYLGFTGVITFSPKKNNPEAQEELLKVVRNTPLDRIVVETDSPYMAPVPYRGQKSEPWMVEQQIKKIAEIKGLIYEDVEQQIADNTFKLFPKMKKK